MSVICGGVSGGRVGARLLTGAMNSCWYFWLLLCLFHRQRDGVARCRCRDGLGLVLCATRLCVKAMC